MGGKYYMLAVLRISVRRICQYSPPPNIKSLEQKYQLFSTQLHLRGYIDRYNV